MNRLDELYYNLKELRQSLDFYQNKADRKVRGAKVKLRTIKTQISNLQEEFVLEQETARIKEHFIKSLNNANWSQQ